MQILRYTNVPGQGISWVSPSYIIVLYTMHLQSPVMIEYVVYDNAREDQTDIICKVQGIQICGRKTSVVSQKKNHYLARSQMLLCRLQLKIQVNLTFVFPVFRLVYDGLYRSVIIVVMFVLYIKMVYKFNAIYCGSWIENFHSICEFKLCVTSSITRRELHVGTRELHGPYQRREICTLSAGYRAKLSVNVTFSGVRWCKFRGGVRSSHRKNIPGNNLGNASALLDVQAKFYGDLTFLQAN